MQRKSSNTVEVKFFKLNYQDILKKLKEYAEKWVEKGAKAVILIGSLARGDYTAFSDADIVIISDKVPPRPIDRIKDYIDPKLPIDLEPRIYTTKEVIKMAKEKRRIIKEIVGYGKLLAGNRELIKELEEILKH